MSSNDDKSYHGQVLDTLERIQKHGWVGVIPIAVAATMAVCTYFAMSSVQEPPKAIKESRRNESEKGEFDFFDDDDTSSETAALYAAVSSESDSFGKIRFDEGEIW